MKALLHYWLALTVPKYLLRISPRAASWWYRRGPVPLFRKGTTPQTMAWAMKAAREVGTAHMAEHTRGPWWMGDIIEDDFGQQSRSIGPFEAACHYEDTIAEVFGDNHPLDANARLIAAAPDLLAACEAAIEADNSGWDFGKRASAMLRVRAAIRKATGDDDDRDA